MIEINLLNLSKDERGTHEGYVTVHRQGKIFQRKQRLGRKNIKDQIKHFSTKELEQLAATTNNQEILKLLNNETLSVRKIVVKRINMEGLYSIAENIEDDEPEIANIVFKRLDMKGLYKYMNSNHESTRIRVAKNIDQKGLYQMMNDPSDLVRENIASRINQDGLLKMINDKDSGVRFKVASRINIKELYKMINDPDKYVRGKVASRIDMKGLYQMIDDNNNEIKKIIANRIDKKGLELMKEKNKNNTELLKYIDIRLSLLKFITKDVINKFQKTGKIQFNEDIKKIIKNAKEFNSEHNAIIELADKLYSNSKYNDFHLISRRDWVDNPNLGTSLLLKDSIERLYGGKTYYSALNEKEKKIYLEKEYKKFPKNMVDEYVKLQKSLTQQLLNIKYPNDNNLIIYRGTSLSQSVGYGTNLKIKENSLTSWSMRRDIAKDFANKIENGVVLKTKVNKNDIWSCYLTHSYGEMSEKGILSILGGGLKPENEIIIINNKKREVKIV